MKTPRIRHLHTNLLRAPLALASLLLLAGCAHHAPKPQAHEDAPQADVTDGSLAAIRQRGELRVGVALVPPFVFASNGGAYRGYDLDLVSRLAEDLGVKLTVAERPLCSLIDELRNAKFDIALAGMTPTPERGLFVNFSDPIGETPFVVLRHVTGKGRKGEPLKALAASSTKIGAVQGTVAEAVARERFPDAALVAASSYEALLHDVESGALDAVVVSSAVARAAAGRAPGKLEFVAGAVLSTRPEAIAVRRGDRDLRDYLNLWIGFYRASGWLEDRHASWFERFEWAKPDGGTHR